MIRFLKRLGIWLLTFVLAVVLLATGLIYIFERGPSETIRDMYVVTVMQTSAAKFTATLFLDQETVDGILKANTVEDDGSVTDPSLIHTDEHEEDFDINGLTVESIEGPTYKGKVMVVNDPSRVYVHSITLPATTGELLSDMCINDDAIAGVNGGGFEDTNGLGQGNLPAGIVISHGKYISGNKDTWHCVIGFNQENKLVVGGMTGQQAIRAGIRDAVEWGPALIVNGKVMDVGDIGGGLNPRTAIGQRADGAVILVVIDGRQPSSMGASYADLVDIMLKYGAVNAGNLDGGLSTSMWYDGRQINNEYALTGVRPIPTGVLVKKVAGAP